MERRKVLVDIIKLAASNIQTGLVSELGTDVVNNEILDEAEEVLKYYLDCVELAKCKLQFNDKGMEAMQKYWKQSEDDGDITPLRVKEEDLQEILKIVKEYHGYESKLGNNVME